MRIVSSAELRKVLDLPALIDFLGERHREPPGDLADGLIGGPESRYLIRSATGAHAFGSKLVTIMPGNAKKGLPSVQALLVLFDAETGVPKAALEATDLTYWKTAADSALASRYLSRKDSGTLLICGAGGLAPWLVRGHLAARQSLSRILIWNRTFSGAERLAAELRGEGIAAEAIETLRDGIAAADIVCTATIAREPFLKGEWLRAGQHVDLVGSFGPDTRESDDACIRRARIFVDRRESAFHGVGDILGPLASGALTKETIAGDLYQLARGEAGRASPDEITLFKNAGGAHLDLMTAEFLLARLEAPPAAR